jgi:hypothetical protein
VFEGLKEMRWRVRHCELAGATPFVTFESLDGSVRISDVRLEGAPGPDTTAEAPRLPVPERAVECLRAALVGNVIGSPAARPGRTFELPFEPGPAE